MTGDRQEYTVSRGGLLVPVDEQRLLGEDEDIRMEERVSPRQNARSSSDGKCLGYIKLITLMDYIFFLYVNYNVYNLNWEFSCITN